MSTPTPTHGPGRAASPRCVDVVIDVQPVPAAQWGEWLARFSTDEVTMPDHLGDGLVSVFDVLCC